MFAACYGGLGPGIAATVLSTAACVYFMISPVASLMLLNSADVVGAVLFLGVCTFISILNENLRSSRATSEQRLQDLTQEIIRRTRVELTLADSRRNAERARDRPRYAVRERYRCPVDSVH